MPTLRFRMFRKRVRRVPHAANARHGRFDLDAKRSFRLLPRTLLLSRCKWPRRGVKFRFYLCVFTRPPELSCGPGHFPLVPSAGPRASLSGCAATAPTVWRHIKFCGTGGLRGLHNDTFRVCSSAPLAKRRLLGLNVPVVP